MIRRTLRISSAIVLAGLVAGGFAIEVKAKPSSGTIVHASFRCSLLDAACPTPGASDRIDADGLGGYVGVGDAATGAGAFLDSSGEFELRLQAGGGRMLLLDFGSPDGSAPCAQAGTCQRTFDTVASGQAEMHSNTLDLLGEQLPNGLLDIPVGEQREARLKVNFPDPYGRNLLWTVRFNPTDYPGSTTIVARRIDLNTWELEATTDDRAKLVSTVLRGRGQTDEGQFVMPFKVVVRR